MSHDGTIFEEAACTRPEVLIMQRFQWLGGSEGVRNDGGEDRVFKELCLAVYGAEGDRMR